MRPALVRSGLDAQQSGACQAKYRAHLPNRSRTTRRGLQMIQRIPTKRRIPFPTSAWLFLMIAGGMAVGYMVMA
jgi:hypothetical protein